MFSGPQGCKEVMSVFELCHTHRHTQTEVKKACAAGLRYSQAWFQLVESACMHLLKQELQQAQNSVISYQCDF